MHIILLIFASVIAIKIWNYFLNKNDLVINFNPHKKIFINKLNSEQKDILARYSSYYRHLPSRLKLLYEDRVIKFIKEKQFVAKGDHTITDEKKLLIADSAIKLTFGLHKFLYEQFVEIIIFKDEFYSEFSNLKEKGETNPRGAIIFSWKDIVYGDIKEDDGINLGLHEFAHALMVQNIGYQGYDEEYFSNNICYFEDFYNNKEMIANVREHHLFREYAFTNKMEFFAICCEQFFEVPEKIKSGLPKLYKLLCVMLNQDPLVIYAKNEINN